MITTIDINCDMGEGLANDEAIMPYITSANIACGYHAGDEELMFKTVKLAKENNVKIGAHPSFPDRANFGRANMTLPPNELKKVVKLQIEHLVKIASSLNVEVYHVKPHGALYNMAAKDEKLSHAICDAIESINPNMVVYGLSGSLFLQVAGERGFKVAHEVFADRTYQEDGTLTPRTSNEALILDEEVMIKQVLQLVKKQQVTTVSGKIMPLKAETLCIHGDGQNALSFAKRIYGEVRG
jgi:5-oxoprolinase (ATP-hydrolysing) subunit A